MIVRAETTNRISSRQSLEFRESMLNEIEAVREAFGPREADRLMNLVMDGQEPNAQLFGGATLSEIQ